MPGAPRPVDSSTRLTRRGLLQGIAALPLAGCISAGGGAAAEAPPDYPAAMRQVLQAVGRDLPGYQFRSTPISNFGVGSLYLDELSDPGLQQVESRWFLGGPQAWLQPAGVERQRWLARLVAEGSMGSLDLSHDVSRDVHAAIGLSVLAALVGSARLDYRKGVTTSFHADEARNRRLNWVELEAALAAGKINAAVAKVLRQGNFIVAAADLVLLGYRAEIRVDEAANPQLAASLRTNVLLPRLNDVGGGFSLSESARGQFSATASQPVIAAVLFKRPPPRDKSLPAGASLPALDLWPAAPLSSRALRALDEPGSAARR